MVGTDAAEQFSGGCSGTLQALTAAALVLPGLLFPTPLQAADAQSLALQHSRYEEGRRDLINVPPGSKPLTVDSLGALGRIDLQHSLRLELQLNQDTWSGATAVTTAPLLANGNNPILRNAGQSLLVSGASPLVNGTLPLNRNLQPVRSNAGGTLETDPRNVLVMSSASPELRKQVAATLASGSNTAGFSVGAGVSEEPDYLSRYGNLGYRRDFNQRLSSLNFGAAYTHSATSALLDADLVPYLTRNAYLQQIERSPGKELLHGTRVDRNTSAGLTQVIDAQTQVDLGATLTWSSGFMENPYKAMTVVFVPPAAEGAQAELQNGDVRAFLEQRPDRRRQLALKAGLARYVEPLDAALHLDYHFADDDWGLRAHTLEASWVQPLGDWQLTPRLRYYTQSAANFYQPLLYSRQAYRTLARDPAGREIWQSADSPGTSYYRDSSGNFTDAGGNAADAALLNLQPEFSGYDPQLLPAQFSSDHRLAGFGTASAALTVSRRFASGFTMEAGVEYYERKSAWQAGGADDSAFADYDFVMATIAVEVDLQATPRRLRRQAAMDHAAHAMGTTAMAHAGHRLPAGLMFAHMPLGAGSVMLGHRSSMQWQSGTMLEGRAAAADSRIVASGCNPQQLCRYVPDSMQMTMHMLDLMYAPDNSLTLMLMPQFMTMDMETRELQGRPPPVPGVHEHNSGHAHVSAALGDTLVAALFPLGTGHGLHASVGLSMPTGKVNLEYRRSFRSDGGLQHFDMQTGSGTWDLLPALTWSTTGGQWQQGLQLSGTRRLESRNASGYRLGNSFQASGWATRSFTDWLGATLRLVHTRRGAMAGDFSRYSARSGPMDFPANHGGQYWDLGLGLNFELAGNSLALEWLQPVRDKVRGFQLERQGSLAATWHYSF